MLIDCNVIAYYTVEEALPFKRYKSGELDAEKAPYSELKDDNNPTLIIPQDIVSDSGYGIKKGFYKTKLSDEFDFLIIHSNGVIRAKAPILKIETIKKDKKTLKKDKSWQFWHKKDHLGEDSAEFVHQKAEIRYDEGNDSYIIFWERGNTKVTALIKL
ncbi:hypothetical protein IKA15_02210 [bacterium]|nr:hypothetical protein [bacterium]